MQTTLRIDDQLYREAKAEAAREGTTLTRFLEDGLRLRLKRKPSPPSSPHFFRVYVPEKPSPLSWSDITRIADEEQEKEDLAKLEIKPPIF